MTKASNKSDAALKARVALRPLRADATVTGLAEERRGEQLAAILERARTPPLIFRRGLKNTRCC